jgi:hypothetical protein
MLRDRASPLAQKADQSNSTEAQCRFDRIDNLVTGRSGLLQANLSKQCDQCGEGHNESKSDDISIHLAVEFIFQDNFLCETQQLYHLSW